MLPYFVQVVNSWYKGMCVCVCVCVCVFKQELKQTATDQTVA